MLFNRFWMRHRRLIFILVLFAAPVIPLFALKVTLPRLNFYDKLSAYVVYPIAETAENLGRGLGVVWSHYIDLVHTSRERDAVKKENLELRGRILQLEEFESENKRLKELLSMTDLPPVKAIGGKVIGQDSSTESMSFVINVGTDQGISPRMPVVSSEGVVGTITRVYAHSSVFVALVDPSHDVDGIITRSRARFIVEGRGSSLLGRLKYLDRAEDIRAGDLVVTSGLDGVFPKGLPMGFVVDVDRPRVGVAQEAEMRASVDFGHLEEVLVLKYKGTDVDQQADDNATANQQPGGRS